MDSTDKMESTAKVQNLKVRGIVRRARLKLPFFSYNMLGLVPVHIWIQCCIYDRYTSTDSGIVTIATNMLRVVILLVLVFVVARAGFSEKAQVRMGYISIAAMMAGAALFLLYFAQFASPQVFLFACLCSAFGAAWGGGMWVCVFIRLAPREAFFYTFLTLGISSILCFFLGLLPIELTYLVAILMPPSSFIMYQRARRILESRDAKADSAEQEHKDAGVDAIYDSEPRLSFLRLILGLVFFNLALGIARGFPHGASIVLPLAFQGFHQFGSCALCLILLWWVLVKGRTATFSSLCHIPVLFISAGILCLATLDLRFQPFGASLISIASSFTIGLLWFCIYDIARHSKRYASYLIFGFMWAVYLFSGGIGRLAIWVSSPYEIAEIAITTVSVLLLAGSILLLMSDSIPRVRPLFAEFRAKKPKDLELGVRPGESAGEAVLVLQEDLGEEAAAAHDALEGSLEAVRIAHHLTEREVEVIRFLAQGRSKTSIGKKLYISENTVKSYVKNIYVKLDVHNKQELLDCLDTSQE